MADDFSFEFIGDDELEFTSRGRKSTVPPQLVEALRKLTPKQALKLTSFSVDMKSAKAKTDKARYGAIIRSASKQANVTVSIMWSLSGVPQVIRTEKRK